MLFSNNAVCTNKLWSLFRIVQGICSPSKIGAVVWIEITTSSSTADESLRTAAINVFVLRSVTNSRWIDFVTIHTKRQIRPRDSRNITSPAGIVTTTIHEWKLWLYSYRRKVCHLLVLSCCFLFEAIYIYEWSSLSYFLLQLAKTPDVNKQITLHCLHDNIWHDSISQGDRQVHGALEWW